MNNKTRSAHSSTAVRVLTIAALALAPLASAHAYVGPGLGLGTLIIIVSFIGSLLLAVFGIFWYPIKRTLRKRRSQADNESPEAPDDSTEPESPNP